MAQERLISEFVGIGATVGGASLDIITSTPPNSISTLLFAWVIARAAGDERAFWLRCAAVNKTGAGVVSIDSETDVLPSFSTNGIKHAAVNGFVSGGSIILRVTGDGTPGAPDIDWQAVVRFYRS